MLEQFSTSEGKGNSVNEQKGVLRGPCSWLKHYILRGWEGLTQLPTDRLLLPSDSVVLKLLNAATLLAPHVVLASSHKIIFITTSQL